MSQGYISGSNGDEYEYGWLSVGMLRRVVWYKLAEISEVLATSLNRAMSNQLWNVGQFLSDYTAQLTVGSSNQELGNNFSDQLQFPADSHPERTSDDHRIGSWVTLKAGLDWTGVTKNSGSLSEIESLPSSLPNWLTDLAHLISCG